MVKIVRNGCKGENVVSGKGRLYEARSRVVFDGVQSNIYSKVKLRVIRCISLTLMC